MQFVLAISVLCIARAVAELDDAAKNRPVTKVINLLKDMQKQLEKEGEEDEEIYEKMGCWCVTNEKVKTKTIADGQTQVEVLTSSVESLTAGSAKLNAELGKLEEEVKANTEALETATANRDKEMADFNKYEKEQIVTIEQLKGAVIALSKVHDASLIQGKKSPAPEAKKGPSSGFAKSIEAEALRVRMRGVLTSHPHEYLTALLQVGHKTMKASHRQALESYLKKFNPEDTSDDEDIDDPDGPLPDHISDYFPSKPSYLQTSERAVGQNRPFNKGSDVLRWAKRLHKVEPDAEADVAPLPSLADSDQAAFKSFPSKIQDMLAHALAGVDTALLQEGAGAPASGEIFGVLKQMKENEAINLDEARQAESKAGADYDALKAAKEDEIKAATEAIEKKTDQLATSDEKAAQDKEILEDTQATLDGDIKFLADLKERCGNMDAEFEERKVNRQNEIEAVSKALAFLSSDEAHELFTRTFNPTFIQTSLKSSQKGRAMRRVLNRIAVKYRLPQLQQLALMLNQSPDQKDDPTFKRVRGTIGEMVDKLQAEQTQEMKKRDYCIEEIDQNERKQDHKTRDKKDLEAELEDLTLTIETLDKDLANLKKEISDLEEELKLATENRAKEKKAFEDTVADQRATAKLIKAALGILKGFYGKAALVQTIQYTVRTTHDQAPPPGFAKQEKSAASGGVMGMMEGIIKESEAMEEEAVRNEEAAQKDFDDFKLETDEAIKQKTKESITKESDKATAEQDKTQKSKELEDAYTEFESLENNANDLHKECDFLLKNFEASQRARAGEMEGLRQTVRIFGGAAAFLQRGEAFKAFVAQLE